MKITVVIPTLNEAERIAHLIAATRTVGDCEIIVVDGGSTDDTCQCAATADMCLVTERGRARQQNVGASQATGDVLLFLHADCELPIGAFDAIRAALQENTVVGGCFRQRIEATGIGYRLLEWGNACRVRWWRMAYGDQAIFLRKSIFEELGGFPNLMLMEDVFLMKRLRQRGRFVLLPNCLKVSARRWQQHGLIRQTLRNWILLALARCGVSPDRLAQFYTNTRSTPPAS